MAVSPEIQAYVAGCDERVAATVPEAVGRSEALAARVREAGLDPAMLRSVAALDALPILRKDDLVELQAADPPFGGLVPADARARRLFQSPGPLYEPEREGPDAWRWAPALRAAGFGADDIVLIAFGYHLAPAGAMCEEAVFALGGTVVPAGIGSMELQARACRDLGVTAFIGVPSYLKALLEKATELGLEPEAWRLRRAFVAAEPLPASLREWLTRLVAIVRQGYGTAETGCLGYECGRVEGLHLPADALVTVCDPDTGAADWSGGEGEVVVTLFSPEYPLVRFGTGDLSAIVPEPCGCGIPTPRLAGVLGRVGEAVKVRGMFVHPRQARATLEEIPGLERFRLVVEREAHRDLLRCEVVPADGVDRERLRAEVAERIRSGLRFAAEVVAVEQLPADAAPIDDRRRWD